MSEPKPGSTERETDRIEAFSDGVFDIAITLLILDIKVPHQRTAAATFYAFGLLLPAGSWFLMWLYATHGRRIVDNRLDPGYLRRMTVQYGGSVALYLGAVLLSLIDFRWGLGVCVGLSFSICCHHRVRAMLMTSHSASPWPCRAAGRAAVQERARSRATSPNR
jgi:MFS family permease